ncbi:MAG: hypothetical protein HY899_02535 [Deltaproteobacteria bacterium]|nr:hypothetical protein [Deltaproteobacteria bacterium]
MSATIVMTRAIGRQWAGETDERACLDRTAGRERDFSAVTMSPRMWVSSLRLDGRANSRGNAL